MGRFFTAYQTRIPATGVVIEADGVKCEPSAAPYRAALVAHLPGNLNQGNHGIYVDVLDYNERLAVNPPLKIGWTWVGRKDDEPAPPQPLDKTSPADTASGNIALGKGQVASVWLQDGDVVISNMVSGLSTAISDADPATGNSIFHNSYYIVFAPQVGTVTEPTPQPPTPPIDCAECQRQLTELRTRLDAITKLVNSWIGD